MRILEFISLLAIELFRELIYKSLWSLLWRWSASNRIANEFIYESLRRPILSSPVIHHPKDFWYQRVQTPLKVCVTEGFESIFFKSKIQRYNILIAIKFAEMYPKRGVQGASKFSD